jgi:hypothetical protein
LNLKTTSFGYISEVWFRKNEDEDNGTLKIADMPSMFKLSLPQDTLRYFGTAKKKYKYINYTDEYTPTKKFKFKNSITGWVEIIEEGSMDIFRGFAFHINVSPNGGSVKVYTPMYCLKKDNTHMVLIAGPNIAWHTSKKFMLFKVDNINKEHFMDYISDYPELAEVVKNQRLLFWNIEKNVKEYNSWARIKNN